MTSESEQMIQHITGLVRRSKLSIDENTPLVSSGLIDSLTLVRVLQKLEDVTHTRIPPGSVQPQDLDTVRMMFATVRRVGLPRK